MALKESPEAFSSKYETTVLRGQQSWEEQAESAVCGRNRATFFAFDDGNPVGMASFYQKELENLGELIQVWIAPDYRGRGFAQQLLNTILEWASNENFEWAVASVQKNNVRAINHYLKQGFSDESPPLQNHNLSNTVILYKSLS